MSTQVSSSVQALFQGQLCARFFAWACLFGVLAAFAELIDPRLLDPWLRRSLSRRAQLHPL